MTMYLPDSTEPDNDTQPALPARGDDHVTMTSSMTSRRRRLLSNGIGQTDRATWLRPANQETCRMEMANWSSLQYYQTLH